MRSGCEMEDKAPLFLLMDSVPLAWTWLNTQLGNGDACSERAMSIKWGKLIMACWKQNQKERKILCEGWALGLEPWEMQRALTRSATLCVIDTVSDLCCLPIEG